MVTKSHDIAKVCRLVHELEVLYATTVRLPGAAQNNFARFAIQRLREGNLRRAVVRSRDAANACHLWKLFADKIQQLSDLADLN
jgi:hypothetical protein